MRGNGNGPNPDSEEGSEFTALQRLREQLDDLPTVIANANVDARVAACMRRNGDSGYGLIRVGCRRAIWMAQRAGNFPRASPVSMRMSSRVKSPLVTAFTAISRAP